jgi:hypothetical protein
MPVARRKEERKKRKKNSEKSEKYLDCLPLIMRRAQDKSFMAKNDAKSQAS